MVSFETIVVPPPPPGEESDDEKPVWLIELIDNNNTNIMIICQTFSREILEKYRKTLPVMLSLQWWSRYLRTRHVAVSWTTCLATCVTGGRRPRRWWSRSWSTCPPSITRSRPSLRGERLAGATPPTEQRARVPVIWTWTRVTPPCPGSWSRRRGGCSGRRWGWSLSPTPGWSRRVTSVGAPGVSCAASAGARAGSGVSTVTGMSTSPAARTRLTTAAAV